MVFGTMTKTNLIFRYYSAYQYELNIYSISLWRIDYILCLYLSVKEDEK